jgi:hypothetical protein
MVVATYNNLINENLRENTHEGEFYEQDRAVFCFEHFTGCHWMQRVVDQRSVGRFAGVDADSVESRGSHVDFANGETDQSNGGTCYPEHLSGSQQRPDFPAVTL